MVRTAQQIQKKRVDEINAIIRRSAVQGCEENTVDRQSS